MEEVMNNYKVSVIVPVYNCKKQLYRCVDALVMQTLKAVQIILVNDGSTDGSDAICEEYDSRYDNIFYINQYNQGVSEARNAGLRLAVADYVMYADADDYYENDAIENLYSVAIKEEADMVVGGVKKNIYGDIQIVSGGNYSTKKDGTKQEIIFLMTQNFMLNPVWGKLYRKRLIIQNKVYFNKNLKCGEDLEWLCRFMMYSATIISISDVVYNYIIEDKQSLSQRFSYDYFDRINCSFLSLRNLYSSEEMLARYGKDIYKRHANNIWNGFYRINRKNYRLSFREKIKNTKVGIESDCVCCYLENNARYLPIVKEMMLRIKNPYVLTVLLLLLGYIYER